MRTKYAIITARQAEKIGLDPSAFLMTGDGSIIVTETLVSAQSDVQLYTRQDLMLVIDKNNSDNHSTDNHLKDK